MINATSLKNKIAKVIAVCPSSIVLKRASRDSDGMNGYTSVEKDVATFNAYIDTSGMFKNYYTILQESGIDKPTRTLSFYAIQDDSFTIQMGDYFTLNNVKYKVTSAQVYFNAFWMCSIEGEPIV